MSILDHPERAFIKDLQQLPDGDLFIDVGANAGYYAINLADQYREIWAVEPCHVFVEQLQQNLAKYQVSNVTIIEKAISDTSGMMPFYGNRYVVDGRDNPSLQSQLTLSFEGRHKHLPLNMGAIETTTLTDLIGARHVSLVKVDTEGNERDVVWGAQRVMHQIDAWHIEVHDWNDTHPMRALLEMYGYTVTERGMDWRQQGWLLAKK